MDRRRALLAGGGFPANYLFKEGLGFREDLVYKTYFPSGAGATITNNSIYIHGGSKGSAVLMLNHGTTITGSDEIISSVVNVDFSKYTKLCVESTDQANVSRRAYVGIYKEGMYKPTLEKISRNPSNYIDPYADFYTGNTRTVHTLDISSKNGGSFVMVSPDFSLKLEVYNIWLE